MKDAVDRAAADSPAGDKFIDPEAAFNYGG
jgi:hypothetical protein